MPEAFSGGVKVSTIGRNLMFLSIICLVAVSSYLAWSNGVLKEQNEMFKWAMERGQFEMMTVQDSLRKILYSPEPDKAIEQHKKGLERCLAYSIKETLEAYDWQLKAAGDMKHLKKWADSHPDKVQELLDKYDLKVERKGFDQKKGEDFNE